MEKTTEDVNQRVECVLVESKTHPFLSQIEKTYVQSFPPEERRDFSLVRELIESEAFNAYVLLKEKEYVGFITAWQWEGFAYIEHFAIDASARNGGIGREALQQLLDRLHTPVVLEVEMPADEMSLRRIGFYQRVGFVLREQEYQQPPYRPGESWLDMRLMSYGPINWEANVETIKQTLYREVYGQNEYLYGSL